MNLTGDILKKVVPNLPIDRADELAEISNQLCVKYGMNNVDVYHEFIANVAHESGGFTIMKESLYYTTPSRLVAVWPSRFTLTHEAGKKDANQYVRQPNKLANLVYGGRMGNNNLEDGSTFVGGGYAQITGRDAYEAYRRYLNTKEQPPFTIEELAEKVQTNPMYAFDSAFWFFCEFKNLEQLAIEDKFLEVVKRWNGGTIGLADRKEYYERAKQYIV